MSIGQETWVRILHLPVVCRVTPPGFLFSQIRMRTAPTSEGGCEGHVGGTPDSSRHALGARSTSETRDGAWRSHTRKTLAPSNASKPGLSIFSLAFFCVV